MTSSHLPHSRHYICTCPERYTGRASPSRGSRVWSRRMETSSRGLSIRVSSGSDRRRRTIHAMSSCEGRRRSRGRSSAPAQAYPQRGCQPPLLLRSPSRRSHRPPSRRRIDTRRAQRIRRARGSRRRREAPSSRRHPNRPRIGRRRGSGRHHATSSWLHRLAARTRRPPSRERNGTCPERRTRL
jgi:hypothetical protein